MAAWRMLRLLKMRRVRGVPETDIYELRLEKEKEEDVRGKFNGLVNGKGRVVEMGVDLGREMVRVLGSEMTVVMRSCAYRLVL